MKALTSTIGVLLAALVTIIALTYIGVTLMQEQATLSYKVLDVKVVSLVRNTNSYTLTLIVTNHASKTIKITRIDVYDGSKKLVYGDDGRVDGIPPSYPDGLPQPILVPPGRTMTLHLMHRVPRNFILQKGVTVTVHFTIDGNQYSVAASGTAAFSPQYIQLQQGSGATVCGVRVSFTSRDGRAHTVNYLIFKLSSSLAPCISKYTSLAGHLVIKDSNGVSLPYAIIYEDGSTAWVAVKDTVTLSSTPYTITVIVTDKGEKADSATWGWVAMKFSVMNTFTVTRITPLYYERLVTANPEYIVARTRIWYDRRPFTVTGYSLSTPPLRGIEIYIREYGVATVYQLNFTTIDGTQYMAYVKSADWYHPEIEVYRVSGGTKTLVYQRDFGTTAWPGPQFEIVADSSVPRHTGVNGRYARFVVGKPIVSVSLMPLGGDGGNSLTYLYAYAGADGNVDWYAAEWYAIAKVSYQPLS